MTNKVTGLHLSITALKTLKYYCLLHECSMSKVVDDLILTCLQLPGKSFDGSGREHEL